MSALEQEIKAVVDPQFQHLKTQLAELSAILKEQTTTAPLLTVEGAAKFLNCNPETIRRKVRRGVLKCTRVGNQMRFSHKDLV